MKLVYIALTVIGAIGFTAICCIGFLPVDDVNSALLEWRIEWLGG